MAAFLIKSTFNFGCGTILLKEKSDVNICEQSIIVHLIWIDCNFNFKLLNSIIIVRLFLLDYCFILNLPIIHWKYPTGENNLKLDKSFVGSIGEIKKGRNRQTRLNVLKSYKRVKIVVKRWCVVSNKRKHTLYRRVSLLVYYVRKHTFVILVEVKFSFVCTLEKEIDRQRVSQCEGRDRSFTTHGAFSHYLLQYNTTHISFPMNSMWE